MLLMGTKLARAEFIFSQPTLSVQTVQRRYWEKTKSKVKLGYIIVRSKA